MHQKLRTHWRGPPADACQRVFSCEGKGDPFLYERRRGELSYAMAYGYGPEFVAEGARGEHLGDPACERAGRGPRPLGRERRRGRQVPRARSAWRRCCGRVPGARAASVGPAPSASIRLTRCLTPGGRGHPSLPPPGGWSRVSVPPGGGVGHGRAPCAGAWPRQCEYRTETDGRVARKLMRFLLSSY